MSDRQKSELVGKEDSFRVVVQHVAHSQAVESAVLLDALCEMMLARLSASGASFSSSDGPTSYQARPTTDDDPWRLTSDAFLTDAASQLLVEEATEDASSILVSCFSADVTATITRLFSLLFSSDLGRPRTTMPESEVATEAAEMDADLAPVNVCECCDSGCWRDPAVFR